MVPLPPSTRSISARAVGESTGFGSSRVGPLVNSTGALSPARAAPPRLSANTSARPTTAWVALRPLAPAAAKTLRDTAAASAICPPAGRTVEDFMKLTVTHILPCLLYTSDAADDL